MPRSDKNWNNNKKPKFRGKGPEGDPKFPQNINGPQIRFSLGYILLMVVAVGLLNYFIVQSDDTVIPYSQFKAKVSSGEIKRVDIDSNYYTGYTELTKRAPQLIAPKTPASPVYKTVPLEDPEFTRLLDSKGIEYQGISRQGNAVLTFFLYYILPIVIMVLIWRFAFKRFGNANSNVLAFGQNKAMIVAEGDVQTKFADVAGVDEAKEELVEVVDFLKNPRKYTDIGGKIPKGVLLVGPPGTGKTLLARAVAGEAGVPFFKMSGADFVEMFVGVGASRVRDLFKQAREKAPCIIFIDELDAIGKSRITGAMGGNDEREQTLNQMLVEMDGFETKDGVIILAATNRPDVLDPALLRPGRFDRQVVVGMPDIKEREAILRIHGMKVPLDGNVDMQRLARATPGMSGADLANLINEAALFAARKDKPKVEMSDMEEARDKILMGVARHSMVMPEKDRRMTAVHESGHALLHYYLKDADPLHKVTIVPRGQALGLAISLPETDSYSRTRGWLNDRICICYGGFARKP